MTFVNPARTAASILAALTFVLAACSPAAPAPATSAPAAAAPTTAPAAAPKPTTAAAAAAPAAAPTTAPAANPAPAAAAPALPADAAPPDQQVLVLAYDNTADFTTLDFWQSVYGRAGANSDLLTEPLVRLNKNFDIVPGAATKWSVDSTNLVWTFNLDPNLMWSDDTPVTADDYVATFQLRRRSQARLGLHLVLRRHHQELGRRRRRQGARSTSSASRPSTRTRCRSRPSSRRRTSRR